MRGRHARAPQDPKPQRTSPFRHRLRDVPGTAANASASLVNPWLPTLCCQRPPPFRTDVL
eukprot:2648787-Alexandrium_andersonii.AAC.1